MSKWRRKREVPNKVPLVNFLTNGKVLVCSADSMYYPQVWEGKCSKCGRHIVCSHLFENIPTKVCVQCAPNIPENFKENLNEETCSKDQVSPVGRR